MSNPLEVICKSWNVYIEPLLKSPKLIKLKEEILPNEKYMPHSENIFRVFSMPLNNINIVILGQDPYFGIEQANGLAFAVNSTTRSPKSLQVIREELMKEFYPDMKGSFQLELKGIFDKTLQLWVAQGVFLLNTTLTVRIGKPNSHIEYWKDFTKGIISIISSEVNPIWILWGSHARQYKDLILTTNKESFVLEAAHPASEAYMGKGGFYGNNHFIKTNEELIKRKKEPVKWLN
jgi:uracil-DNA glycosylase